MKDYSLPFTLFFILAIIVTSKVVYGTENVQVQESASMFNKTVYADKIISNKYKEGPFLIYDCVGKFWACIDADGFKDCQKERKEAKEKAKLNLSCTPIQEFATNQICFVNQQKMVDYPRPSSFCLFQEELGP